MLLSTIIFYSCVVVYKSYCGINIVLQPIFGHKSSEDVQWLNLKDSSENPSGDLFVAADMNVDLVEVAQREVKVHPTGAPTVKGIYRDLVLLKQFSTVCGSCVVTVIDIILCLTFLLAADWLVTDGQQQETGQCSKVLLAACCKLLNRGFAASIYLFLM